MHTTNNTRRATNGSMKKGMKIDGIQYYSTYQESILSELVAESDIYDNYNCASFVDWELEKTPEAHPKEVRIQHRQT